MSPETYMKHYHGSCGCAAQAEACPLEAEAPCCPLPESRTPCEPQAPAVTDSSCCKASMAEALRLLCGDCLAGLVDFDAFFFLTDSLAVGSPLAIPGTDTDNITTPTASLQRFSPCNCDLLDVGGTAYFAEAGSTSVAMDAVDQLALCALKAVAFQITPSECDDECADTNYRRAVRAIRRAIREEGGNTGACGACGAHCDCDDCGCAAGIIRELSSRNLSRMATLIAGPFVLRNVTVLGSVGTVLVMADEALSRFYLVCADTVEAIG